ncbi:hypothetical protein [Streptomyces profundus]|uniref:hypothetical protein n=1 Tax=Streptomyces profundus TaxID=2867410 RepID=UPI001D15E8EB|nr:hypothetical protein [Streptomyces sp. MA3_2.13]UED86577.1 hypothetical protein K4G22_22260 [Streptomyces sp. MA3_2.13]
MSARRAPTRRRPHAGLALFLALVVGGAFAALWAAAGEWGWLAGAPLLVAALAVLVWPLAKALRAALPLVAAVLVLGCWPIGATGAASWADLTTERNGELVEAVVMERHEADGSDSSDRYTLERANGMGPVRGGELRPEAASFQVLDRITIVEDPAGAAAPTLPEDLHTARWAGFWGAGVAVLWAVFVSSPWLSSLSLFSSGPLGPRRTGRGRRAVRRH